MSVPLAQVPDGVRLQQFGKRLAFVVRDGNRVPVFDTNVQHLPGENALWWCPTEQVFVAPTHAETVSRSGKAIGGPAAAGLDRYPVTVRHNTVTIDPTRPIPGAKGNAQTAAGQLGGNTFGPTWDSGPGSFCAGALKANNARKTVERARRNRCRNSHIRQADLRRIRGTHRDPAQRRDGITFTFDDPRYQLLPSSDGSRRAPQLPRVPLAGRLPRLRLCPRASASRLRSNHPRDFPPVPTESPKS